jgi:hypothetical protein
VSQRQRLEGTLHRSLPVTIAIRAAQEGDADDGLLRLTISASSELAVLRTPYWEDPWLETLGHDEGEVDLTRFSDGATVLANHDRYTAVGNTPLAGIGAIERAWLEGGRLNTDIVISRREGLADLRQDIADNLVRNVSIGYVINERVLTKTGKDGAPNEYRITSWMPYELSLVDIPADATVGIGRSAGDQKSPAATYRVLGLPAEGTSTHEGERSMSQAPAPAAIPAASAAAPAAVTETTRAQPAAAPVAAPVAQIREAVRVAGFDNEVALDYIERALPLEQVREDLFRKLAEKANAAPQRSTTSVVIVQDETVTRRDFMADAIAHRMSPSTQLTEGARQFRHMSLLRMAEETLSLSGLRVRGLSNMEIASRALHTSSDFPLILAAVANKRLRAAYEGAPVTYDRWARRAPNAPDFKNINVMQLGAAPDLEAVAEGGEFKYGTLKEDGATYKVAAYGKIVAFTRQSIINDDLRAFDRVLASFGASSRRLENRLVYKQLTSNPVMGDGVALFHADHGNLGGAAAISGTTLGEGRAAVRKQKGLAGEDLNITPSFLLLPTDLEQLGYQYTSSQYVPAKPGDTNEFRAGGRTALEPIVDPVLDATSSSQWYLVGDSSSCDTVEYCWLDGAEGVYLESEPGFDIDGIKLKARLDFAAKVVDHRGMYRRG